MSSKLLIVESPAKAKTIGKYLGGEFSVKSSVGHIRDLPKETGAIRIVEKGEGKWEFIPKYVISDGKKKVISELKAATKASDEIYLASDPDREGEAIAWHLRQVLEPVADGKPFKRVTYNEITESAVLKAVKEPRDIDMPLVDAQQARRILDRLVGYKVSPLLWKNINCANSKTLSAGRVQSVALRLLVERQREIDAFKPTAYFLMGVEAKKTGDAKSFVARLARLDGEKPDIRDADVANKLLLDLAGSELEVSGVKSQPKLRHALSPFTTSTLQQAASSVLGFSPGKTMKLAQSLYEHGKITYMRSDSVNVSQLARAQARDFIVASYGEEFYPQKPNVFASKAKAGVAAQEAHEAIRPTDVNLRPDSAKLEAQELKLYDLIWRRFVASQMADAKTTVETISIAARKSGMAHDYLFTASATKIDFEGFLKVMKLSLKKKRPDGEDDEDSDEVAYLPDVAVGEILETVRWLSDEKQTKGPSHYSEASLIKALEENGVGRPSTYATTIETLKAREYAKTEKKKLIPLERGILVCDWLVKKMNDLFSVGYTAQMESELDEVEEKGVSMNDMLSRFYSRFLQEIADSSEPPPDAAKFKAVFALLDSVKEWKHKKKIGTRVYDDKAFVESVKEQAAAGKRPLTERQLQFLVRIAVMYADQIPDCDAKLRAAGLGGGASPAPAEGSDPELVKFCFEVLDRVEGAGNSKFLRSLRDQWDRGRVLSPRQFFSLARAVCESVGTLPDAAEIRARLTGSISGMTYTATSDDPTIPKLLDLFNKVSEWRPAVKRGKREYDDKAFVTSVSEQYASRHTLSRRQVSALKRVALAYRNRIPNFDELTKGLTLKDGEGDAGKNE